MKTQYKKYLLWLAIGWMIATTILIGFFVIEVNLNYRETNTWDYHSSALFDSFYYAIHGGVDHFPGEEKK